MIQVKNTFKYIFTRSYRAILFIVCLTLLFLCQWLWSKNQEDKRVLDVYRRQESINREQNRAQNEILKRYVTREGNHVSFEKDLIVQLKDKNEQIDKLIQVAEDMKISAKKINAVTDLHLRLEAKNRLAPIKRDTITKIDTILVVNSASYVDSLGEVYINVKWDNNENAKFDYEIIPKLKVVDSYTKKPKRYWIHPAFLRGWDRTTSVISANPDLKLTKIETIRIKNK